MIGVDSLVVSSWDSKNRGIGDPVGDPPAGQALVFWSSHGKVSEGSLVEVQEMNNVEIQGGWSAPQQQRCWKHLETLLRYLVVI